MKQLFYFFLIFITQNLLTFLEPQSLREKYSEDIIRYVALNMGVSPVGKSLIGRLVKAEPFNACSELQNEIPDEWGKEILIFYVQRGGECTFAEKIINAQNKNAKMVIIANTINEDIQSLFPVERIQRV